MTSRFHHPRVKLAGVPLPIMDVDWDGQQLQELYVTDVSFLRELQVQRLRLSRNGLKTLPMDIGTCLQQVLYLELQHNDLTTIPHCLLELPNLHVLNLSYNKITEIPDIPECSISLTALDLSHNQLQSLPVNTVIPSIKTLTLSHNHLRYIPPCIFSFTTLLSLDLSDNPDMLLPPHMRNPTTLFWVDHNIEDLVTPSNRKSGDINEFLNSKLFEAKSLYHMKIIVVGMTESGKTTLISRLRKKDCNVKPTVGVDVNEWLYDPGFRRHPVHFTILEFGGLEDYYAAHQDFLSHNSLYLLLFNLMNGKKDLKVWLDNIAMRAPHSHIIIVGTHLDEIPEDKEKATGHLLKEVKELVHCYSSKLLVSEIILVGLKNTGLHKEGTTGVLKEVIYNCFAFYKTSEETITQLLTNRSNPTELLQIVERADNLKECITHVLNTAYHRLQLPQTRAMLLMMKAAVEDDQSLILKLYGEGRHEADNGDFTDDNFRDVQKAVIDGRVSIVVPFRITQLYGHKTVQEMLLLRTNVNKGEGIVCWDIDRLQLKRLDMSWLQHIYWVQRLMLANNGLKTLPNEMRIHLKQVMKLGLQHNDLTTIPHCLLELPSLQELNLSNNKITEIPYVPKWSSALSVLDLSHNQLQSLPTGMIAPSIRVLNLSHNHFQYVPTCLCSFTTLHSLDLSDNPDIHTLPMEMGRLTSLTRLNLRGLKDLKDPPRSIQRDCRDTIRYLNSKLRHAKGFYHMKLMLLGLTNRGKTTLVAQLLGKPYSDESTIGVDISEWHYRPGFGQRQFHFSIWDFGGREEYYATHQCFLSHRCLYLLLFNLTDEEKGARELKSWLSILALRVPRSRVIIIGTHLDEIPDDKRDHTDELLQKVGELAHNYYNKLDITEIIPVGLKNRTENIGVLKEAIYNQAATYKAPRGGQLIMGQMIPASYHTLYKHMEVVQQEVHSGAREPIMHVEEFKTMVQQMNLADIQDMDELKTVTLFLSDVGSLLHFDDRSHNLHELYFIDPRWLCDMMAKLVTIREKNPFIRSGILHSKDIPMMFNDRFPWKYYEQFLTLLDRFEIALPLDNKHILIPSMLSADRPFGVDFKPALLPLYSRYIIFCTPHTPPGFWSRLLSRVMQSVPQVCCLYTSQLQLIYWCSGLFYSDPEVTFRIESLISSKLSSKFCNDGVVIVASPNVHGKKIICKLVDIVTSLVSEWYPSLQEGVGPTSGLEQRVPCYECLKNEVNKPFEFVVEMCLPSIIRNLTTIECDYNKGDPFRNHTVRLEDIVPDLLLQDIDPQFLLNVEDLDYVEDDSSLLGKGGYGKVYKGVYGKEGQQKKPVAIKRYFSRNEEAFSELRMEAKFLHKFHHPCVVSLVGVCIPIIALVMEEAPMGSLDQFLIKRKSPIHRIVLYRICTEVASALRYLHSIGIIRRGLKAQDVLLWTLNPKSLCHVKITDFGIVTHACAIGAKGLIGTKGFIAPEVLYVGKRRQRSVYDHKVDIFSFAMFLYQIIARRHPYHDLLPHRIDSAVEVGDRPELRNITNAKTAFHYLTHLMKACWDDNPHKRPSTKEIIETLCQASTQSIMCVHPFNSRFSFTFSQVLAITPDDFITKIGLAHNSRQLWVCCNGDEGAEVSIYKTNTMQKIDKIYIEKSQVQCISLCGYHVWISSCAGMKYAIDIFNFFTFEVVHRIHLQEESICCFASTEKCVYAGTLEGRVLVFNNDINIIQQNGPPKCTIYISDHAVNGIVITEHHCWVSNTNCISFLNLDNLALEGSVQTSRDFVGKLCLSADCQTVWGAYLGGPMLSAWDVHCKTNKFSIDVAEHIHTLSKQHMKCDEHIAAITPALDTVWVGMASGHILVFHDEELLASYHPYKELRFLTCIPCSGPTNTEECMVVSGGKSFQSPVPRIGNQDNYTVMDNVEEINAAGNAGVLILWEAFNAQSMRQIQMIQQKAPDYLSSYHSARSMIDRGEFLDGTHIMESASDSDGLSSSPMTVNSSDSLAMGDQTGDETPRTHYDAISLPESSPPPMPSELQIPDTQGCQESLSTSNSDSDHEAIVGEVQSPK